MLVLIPSNEKIIGQLVLTWQLKL